ncbi:MAG TPA: hypothetical protein VH092_30805 [Urbifossiella sp.]|nr:hypothetical protein [Urbifossiella sp.]
MTGFALTTPDLPATLLDGLTARVYRRAGVDEVQFHWWQEPTLLPVRWDGALRLHRWGSKDGRSRLPLGGWLSAEGVGALTGTRREEAVIPANLGQINGRWLLIDVGVTGVVLPDVRGGPVVYVLVQPASNYYRNLSGQEPMMPAFVGQVV